MPPTARTGRATTVVAVAAIFAAGLVQCAERTVLGEYITTDS